MASFVATLLSAFGPFGLLLPGLVCAAFIARALGLLVFREAPLRQQLLGGATLALAAFTAGMQLLMYAGAVRRESVLGLLILFTAALGYATRHRQSALVPAGFAARAARREWSLLPLLLVGATGIAVACLAAYWLPIWQWDSLGYHLPFVNFVLQGGGLAELPRDVPYLSTYPRNVELLFVGMRALLPDDRLVDAGQLPLGLLAAGGAFGIARELGARIAEALAAGGAWLLLPAVFLQLPTNYIDVGGAAYFLLTGFLLLCAPTRASLLCAGLALGLFLGTKPSVPPAAALLGLVLLLRAARAKLLGVAALALLLAGALGLEAYVTQLVRHGNPVWPAVVELGPLRLDGTISVQELLSSGAGTQKVHGPLLLRVLASWSSFDATPVFDMRVGGLGPSFWAAVPFACWFVVRRRAPVFAALLVLALLTPDPAVARYVLAFPALVLAGAAAALSRAVAPSRRVAHLVLALLSAFNLRYAIPGLGGEGPPLFAYAAMTWSERAVAVGARGRPVDFVRATGELGAGQIAVYDKALELPYLMWRGDLANRVVRVPDEASDRAVRDLLEAPGVRLVAAGHDQPAARVIAARPGGFIHLFTSPERCSVYRRP